MRVHPQPLLDRLGLVVVPLEQLAAAPVADTLVGGCVELDMGRTDADNPGLREFKFAWGADEEPLTYTYLGAAPGAEGAGRAAGLLRPIISRSPLAVSRVLGRLLYRYAA